MGGGGCGAASGRPRAGLRRDPARGASFRWPRRAWGRVRGGRRATGRLSGSPQRRRQSVAPAEDPRRPGPRLLAWRASRCAHLARSILRGRQWSCPRRFGDSGPGLRAFGVSSLAGGVAVTQGVEARAAAELPAVHGTAPHRHTLSSPKCLRCGGGAALLGGLPARVTGQPLASPGSRLAVQNPRSSPHLPARNLRVNPSARKFGKHAVSWF